MPSTEKPCQGRINAYPRYHLACRKPASFHGANTPSAHNAGNASADTRVSPFPLPSAAHLLLRFSLRSQLCETLCGCAAQFYFRFKGLLIMWLFNYRIVRLSRTFFRVSWKRLPFAAMRDKIKSNFSLWGCPHGQCVTCCIRQMTALSRSIPHCCANFSLSLCSVR